MYKLPYFSEDDSEKLLDFVAGHPFATLVAVASDGIATATHIPVFADKRGEKIVLSGHFLRTSDHCKAFQSNPAALCIFTGSFAYVSATWYTDPHNASTVNYMAAHAKGHLRFLDEQGLRAVLERTSLHFEKGDARSPTIASNLDANELEKMMKQLAAFEIDVSEFSGTFKLSQNRDKESYESIVRHLEIGDAAERDIARNMSINKVKLFDEKK